MRFLKKMILAIGLILLLAFLKIFFARHFPSSSYFHYNLFSSLQLLLFLWAIITGLLEATLWKKAPPRQARLKSSLLFISVIALSELTCIFLLRHPRLLHKAAGSPFTIYYDNYDRDVLQFDRKISAYDTTLFYRMKPSNQSLFSNIEFSDSIFTNSMGFRDDEISLKHGKVICLGDSYTLGWGVRQEEAYPQQLEQMLKQPVLNTGMSSYGTAREIESIHKLDTAGLSTVIIQYCYNDADENRAYIGNNYHLPVSPRSVYDQACEGIRWSKVYFPGKYFCTIAKIFLNEKLSFLAGKIGSGQIITTPSINYAANSVSFLETLKASGLNFSKIHMVVFDIGGYETLNENFANALEKQLKDPENQPFFRDHIHVLHIASLLTPSDYYTLDEHIRASGHRKIASYLAALIRSF